MQYCMTDVGGCLKTFRQLLKKISFSDKEDVLYIAGVTGEGKYSVRLLLDLCMRGNVYPVWGEEDLLTFKYLGKLQEAGSKEEMLAALDEGEKLEAAHWIEGGGAKIMEDFAALDEEKKGFILEYFEEFEPSMVTKEGKRVFVILSGGFEAFEEGKELEEYDPWELARGKIDMDKTYFPKTYLLCGGLHEAQEKVVKSKAGNINLDCGAAYGGKLACLSLENGHVWYQDTDKGDLN